MSLMTHELQRETWRPYFDEMSRMLGATQATVEVVGLDIGDQIEAERLLMTGITYDDKDDIVVIGLDAPGGDREDLQRIVDHPVKIFIATGEPGADAVLDIEDAEHHRTIVTLEHPPALPAA
jgi:hypothetical protein